VLKKFRPYISTGLLLLALLLGFYYLGTHASLYRQLLKTPLSVSLFVFVLYGAMFCILAIIFSATIRLCGITVKTRENLLLNAHSMILNFFVPGQSGPAYRGFYLYSKYKIKIKNFILATLIYYGMYALISTGLLLVTSRPWWQTFAAIIIVCAISTFVVRYYSKKNHLKESSLSFNLKSISYLLLATLTQSALQIIIFGVELHSVNHSIRFSQIVTYTGAANLALFVAITPGAIGIREAFLLFTRRLNHISSNNIIAASFIDRAIFATLLIIMVITLLILSFRKEGQVKSLHSLLGNNLDWAEDLNANDKVVPAKR